MGRRWEVKNVKEYEKFPGSYGGEVWIDGEMKGYVDIWRDGSVGGSYAIYDDDKSGLTHDEENELVAYMRQYLD